MTAGAASSDSLATPTLRRIVLGIAGFLGVFLGPFLAAEAHLRVYPPADLHPYLGEASPLRGDFIAHTDFGYTYRNYHTFASHYARRLAEIGPLNGRNDRPLWALFGNSFLQAPGMLGDKLVEALPTHRMFYLKRNERLELRLAQIDLLLKSGMRPQRVLIELMPVDLILLSTQPLSTIRVNRLGALVYDVAPPPPPLDALVRSSRVALTAWVRAGLHTPHPRTHTRHFHTHLHDDLCADLARLFGAVGRLAREYDVPVTVVLITAREQATRDAGFYFQDTITPILTAAGLDVLDPRDAFMAQADRAALYIPDGHLSDRGNAILLHTLLAHLDMPPERPVPPPNANATRSTSR